MDCSPADFTIHGISQARILEWVAISFSSGSSQPRDRTQVSCIAGRRFNPLSHQGSPREMKESTITTGNSNTLSSDMDRTGRQQTSKDRVELSNINQRDLSDIYRSLLSNKAGYTFSSSSRRTFSETDPILDYKTHLNKFDRKGIIWCLPLDHSGIKPEVRKTGNGKVRKGDSVCVRETG